MSCDCRHGDDSLKFPLFGPAPMGPVERWPEYFVPTPAQPGAGYYFCPSCRVGLAAAREMVGLPPLVEETASPPTVWARLGHFLDWLVSGEVSINSPAIHSR